VLAQRIDGGDFERAVLCRRSEGKTWICPEGGGDEYVATKVCELKFERLENASVPGALLSAEARCHICRRFAGEHPQTPIPVPPPVPVSGLWL